MLLSQDMAEDAERILLQCLEIRRRILPAGHPHLAITLNNMGKALQRKNQCAQAKPYFREALSILSASDFDPARAISVKSHLGACLISEKRYSEAETVLAAAHSECVSLKGATGRDCMEIENQRNALQTLMGN